jgi:hypothetical protein
MVDRRAGPFIGNMERPEALLPYPWSSHPLGRVGRARDPLRAVMLSAMDEIPDEPFGG